MDQNIGTSFTSEPTLQLPPYPKAAAKLPAPLIFIFLFHFVAGDLAFQEGVHAAECHLAAMQGHAHPIARKGRDHSCPIPYKKDMIFHPGPALKAYLRNGQRLLV